MSLYDEATDAQRRAVFEAAMAIDQHNQEWLKKGGSGRFLSTAGKGLHNAVRAATRKTWTVEEGAVRCSDGRVISITGWVSPPGNYRPVSDGTMKIAEAAVAAALNAEERADA